MAFDIMQLPLGELKLLEETAGVPLGQLMNKLASGDYTTAMLEGFALVLGRRSDPDFALEDASEVTFAEALTYLTGGDDGEGKS